jgi:hypothetical protein
MRVLSVVLCSCLLVAACPFPTHGQSPPKGARAAMDVFLAALRDRDVEQLIGCFSKKRAFYLVSTGQPEAHRDRFTRAQLVRGMRAGGDFVGFMFGDDNLDSLRDYASDEWRATSAHEFAVASDGEPLVTVTWAREGARYVVAEIATPF